MSTFAEHLNTQIRDVEAVFTPAGVAIGRQVTYTARGRRKAPSSKRGCVDFAGTAVAR